MLIFVIFVVNLRVTKVSTHEYFHHVTCTYVAAYVYALCVRTCERTWSDCTRCYMLLKLVTMALFRYLRPIDNSKRIGMVAIVASHARLESEVLHLDRTRTWNHVHVRTCQGSHYVIRDRNPGPTKFKTTKILF